MYILCLCYIFYISFFLLQSYTKIEYFRFLDQCKNFFPFKNKQDCYSMGTEKVHSVIHSPNDAARFCHYLIYSCKHLKRDIKYGSDNGGRKQTKVL
jgi:hypothetical protein